MVSAVPRVILLSLSGDNDPGGVVPNTPANPDPVVAPFPGLPGPPADYPPENRPGYLTPTPYPSAAASSTARVSWAARRQEKRDRLA